MNAEVIDLNSEVEALLLEVGLPVSDLSSKDSLCLLGVRKNDQIVGVVGIEEYGTEGLLRSLAVAPVCRGIGLGLRLVTDAEKWAAGRGITKLFLLTTTADEFFARLGFESIERVEAPASIADTSEFKDLCPASSTFMRKLLTTVQKA